MAVAAAGGAQLSEVISRRVGCIWHSNHWEDRCSDRSISQTGIRSCVDISSALRFL